MNASIDFKQSPLPSKKLKQLLKKHPLFIYFVLAYAISWILIIPYALSEWGLLKGNFMVMYVLHTFGPSLAGLIMVWTLEGKEGLLQIWKRIKQVRAGWQWYLFILIGIPALIILGIFVQPGVTLDVKGVTPVLFASYPLTFIAVWFGGGPLGEEIVWRGFALPRLQLRFGPLKGTLLLGLLWCFWHLPDFLTESKGGGPGTTLLTFLPNFFMFFIMILALSIIFTWIFNHTRGSIFTAITAHASVNTPELTLVPLLLGIDMIGLHKALLIGFGVFALLVLIFTRGRLGYKPDQEGSSGLE